MKHFHIEGVRRVIIEERLDVIVRRLVVMLNKIAILADRFDFESGLNVSRDNIAILPDKPEFESGLDNMVHIRMRKCEIAMLRRE
jgi:hypothetical protein